MVMRIGSDEWEDSQNNELEFWQRQFKVGNNEQDERNIYYQNVMEGVCSVIKDFLDFQVLDNKVLLDVGSGPEGILHELKAKEKYAIDPLMDEYKKMGYKISDNNVIPIQGSAEELSDYNDKFDIIFCLNALDHMYDIAQAVRSMYSALVDKGFLVLLTDLRTEDQLDCFHKMSLSTPELTALLESSSFVVRDQMKFGHSEGNSVRQWCGVCQKQK